MDNKSHTKRFKLIFILAMLAFMTASKFIASFAAQAPPQMRRFWLITAMGLLMLPIGYLYGRNSGRKDQLGKLARAIAVVTALGLCIGIVASATWGILTGLCGGYLAGYATGRLLWKTIRKKHGDNLKADRILNVLQSEHAPKREYPAWAYFKSQDQATRKVLLTLYVTEIVSVLAAIGLSLWVVFADRLAVLLRVLHVRQGDGTLYFITTDPIVIAVPLILASICAFGVVCELLLPLIAGTHKDNWLEFKRLRISNGRLARNSRVITVTTCAFAVISVLALLLFTDSYVKVTRSGIDINRFWGLGARYYRWSDVSDVNICQQDYLCSKCGHKHNRLSAGVIFADGTEWKPDTSFARRENEIGNAVRYVAVRKAN